MLQNFNKYIYEASLFTLLIPIFLDLFEEKNEFRSILSVPPRELPTTVLAALTMVPQSRSPVPIPGSGIPATTYRLRLGPRYS